MDANTPYEKLRDEILLDPSVHYSTKSAILVLDERDPVDAVNQVELLTHLFNKRLREVFETHAKAPVADEVPA